jgi:hypothetical protein
MKAQSSYLRLQIADEAKNVLERQAARHGMTQTELASRLVSWLVQQSQVVQAAVLNNITPGEDLDVPKVLLAGAAARVAESQRGGKSRKSS